MVFLWPLIILIYSVWQAKSSYLAYESESSSSNNGIGVRLLTICFEDKKNL